MQPGLMQPGLMQPGLMQPGLMMQPQAFCARDVASLLQAPDLCLLQARLMQARLIQPRLMRLLQNSLGVVPDFERRHLSQAPSASAAMRCAM